MKFEFLRTGSIIETDNEFVIEQMKQSSVYKEIVENAPKKATKKKVDK